MLHFVQNINIAHGDNIIKISIQYPNCIHLDVITNCRVDGIRLHSLKKVYGGLELQIEVGAARALMLATGGNKRPKNELDGVVKVR